MTAVSTPGKFALARDRTGSVNIGAEHKHDHGSKDLQMVSITLRVLSRPDTNHLSKIYQNLGLDYDERFPLHRQ